MKKNQNLPICVAIPVESIDSAIATAQRAVKAKAQFIEFRVDYSPQVSTWEVKDFQRLIGEVKVSVILTMRQFKEGGQLEISEDDRFVIVKKCIQSSPAFVDVEARLDPTILGEFHTLAVENQVALIYSYHDFDRTPPSEEVFRLAENFEKTCPGLSNKVSASTNIKSVLKMIFYAKKTSDNEVPLSLCHKLHEQEKYVVSFCMGEEGIYSRTFCVQQGAYFSFASLDQTTAPGQVSISKFYEIIAGGAEIYQNGAK